MKPEPVDLRIDREGRWFAGGREVIHEKIFRLFCDSLVLEEDGYHIRIDHMENPVAVEDAPISVRSVFVENTAEGNDIIWTVLSDGRRLPLDPATLRAPAADAVYCGVDDGRGFEARFSRFALQQLGTLLEEGDDPDSFHLHLNGGTFEIKVGAPGGTP